MRVLHSLRRIAGTASLYGLLGAALLLAGCANLPEPDALDPPAEADSLIITPQEAEVETGVSVSFTAPDTTVEGTAVSGPVEWTATGGSISPQGVFVSSTSGTFQVRAGRGGRTGGGRVKVNNRNGGGSLVRVEVSPGSVSMAQGATQQFSAVGRMSDSSTQNVAVTWTAAGGTINSSGLFTAGSSSGLDFRIIAIDAGGRADTALVDISATAPTLTAIEVSPATISVAPGGTQQFSAVGRLSNGSTSSVLVNWTATGGAITSGGLYTAGSTAGTFRVIAVRQGDTRADTSTVTISTPPPTPPTLTAVVLTPASVSLQTGATQQFSAVGQMSDGSTQGVAVTWSATGGSVTSGGLYTAGSTAGTFRVIATQQGGPRADTSSITITAPPPTLVAVELTPASVSLQTGATQQFSAVGRRSDGSTQSVTATFTATGGTVSTGGFYTAGSTAGTYRVIASASGFADTSSITVTAPAPTLVAVELTPPSASLQGGATQQFSVIGRRSDGSTQSVTPTYTATGGTITTGGLYTAGSAAGTYRVIASASGFADTSSITVSVTAPTLTAVELTPASVSLQGGATQQFSTIGRMSNGSTTSVTVTYSATGGTITTGGLYTAGSTAGTFRVIAVRQGDTLADTSSVTISVTAPTLTAVELTPASVSVQGGATQQFATIGRRSDGSTQSVTPTYSATGGTVTSGGLYTAGSTAGTFRVISAANGFADTSAVTITVTVPPTLAAIELTPASASLQTGGSQQFSVIGRRSDGSTTAVTATYSATGGTISSGGLYSAGSSAGSFRVIASQQGGSFADTASISLTAPGSFAPPDIEFVTFDQSGDNATMSGIGAPFPGSWHTRSATGGRNGTAAMQIQISGGSLYEPIGIAFGSRTRVFVRYYVRAQGTPAGNVKGIRFHNGPNGNVGGLWAEGPLWGFDQEGSAVQVSSGLSWGNSCDGVPCTGTNLADGQWHSIEMDYDRNAGSYVEARLWVDGRPVILPNGPSDWAGGAYTPIQYVGGNAGQGVPTTIRATRSGASSINDVSFFETISTAQGSATLWIDDIAISSQRIGP